jgi:peroxiredoxin
MESYRDRYDSLQEKNAQVLAVSADKEATQARFRKEIGAPFAFIADSNAELIKLFGIKTPLIKLAKRTTFVIGEGRKIVHVDSGRSAIDPSGALEACSISFGGS